MWNLNHGTNSVFFILSDYTDYTPVFKMSRSYPTSFPTRTVVSRPCVFGSDKKSVFSSHKSSTCAHSSSIPTTAAAGQKASGASVETRPYLKQKRKSYKRGDPVATWVPFVQTSVDSQQFGSSTGNSTFTLWRARVRVNEVYNRSLV